MPSSFIKKILQENPDRLPANFGKPWTDDDEELLFDLIEEDYDIGEIANKLERNEAGINGKLRRCAYAEYKNGKNVNDIQKKFKIKSLEEINNWIEKEKIREENKLKPKQIKKISPTKKDYIYELNNRLTILENIINKNNNIDTKPLFDYDKKNYSVINDEIFVIDEKGEIGEYIGKYYSGKIKIKREIYHKIKNIIAKNIIEINNKKDIKDENKELIEQTEELSDEEDNEPEYETIEYKDKKYYLDGKKVYKINKDGSKGGIYGKFKNGKIKKVLKINKNMQITENNEF